jgi:hypothetical protein
MGWGVIQTEIDRNRDRPSWRERGREREREINI